MTPKQALRILREAAKYRIHSIAPEANVYDFKIGDSDTQRAASVERKKILTAFDVLDKVINRI